MWHSYLYFLVVSTIIATGAAWVDDDNPTYLSLEKFQCHNADDGWKPFTPPQSIIVPHTSPSEIWAYIGDFYNLTWLGVTLTSSDGRDNTVESERTFFFIGQHIKDRLVDYYEDKESGQFYRYIYHTVGTYTFAGGVYFSQLYDTITVQGIGNGAANGSSFVSYNSVACSNDTKAVIPQFDSAYSQRVQEIAAHFS
jgi:hypothetical protein